MSDTINPATFTSEPIFENNSIVIEMRSTRPSAIPSDDETVAPGTLVGYYNGVASVVELYIADNTGTRWIKVR